jgi:SOS response regulatory protein OraA/RecX
MKKHDGPTSERIRDVDISERGVTLLLEKTKLPISKEAYLSGYYYPGKILTQKEIASLRDGKKSLKAASYLEALLSQGRYTEAETAKRLRTKFALPEKEIQELLAPFKEAGILDDRSYLVDYLDAKIPSGYGKKYLTADLLRRGVPAALLADTSLEAQWKKTLTFLPELLAKANATHQNQTQEKRRQYLLGLLLRRGFAPDAARDAIASFTSQATPEEKENEKQRRSVLLRKQAEKCYNSLQRKPYSLQKRKEVFFARLCAQGFSYGEVKDIIEREGYCFK